jgi:hypothetical protein
VARLSIVIPVLGNPKALDDTLVSVLEHRPSHCEILVIHNEPYNDPYQLSNEVSFVGAWRGAGLGECLNLGVSVSTAPVIHILSCGVEVTEGWTHAAMQNLLDANVASVAPVVLEQENPTRVVSAGLSYFKEGIARRVGQGEDLSTTTARQKWLHGPDLLAAFFRKSAIESVGGFALWTSNRLIGIDMALTLHHAGYRCLSEPDCITRVKQSVAAEKTGFSYGYDAEQFFWRWASYNGLVSSALKHARLLAGECASGLLHPTIAARLIGRTLGMSHTLFRNRRSTQRGIDATTLPSILLGPHLSGTAKDAASRQPSRVA